MCKFFRILLALYAGPNDRPSDDERHNNDDEDDGALFV
jgi:hypothetical protein